MSLIIHLGHEVQYPYTLVVMEDEAAAIAEARKYCSALELELNEPNLLVEVKLFGRTFRVHWTWPRTIPGVLRGERNWVWNYAGIELSRLELHTSIPPKDLQYLISRMRGQALKEEQ